MSLCVPKSSANFSIFAVQSRKTSSCPATLPNSATALLNTIIILAKCGMSSLAMLTALV